MMRSAPLYRALLLLLAASTPAVAKQVVADPASALSLDLDVRGSRTCIMYPEALRDPAGCEGLGPAKDPEKAGPGLRMMGIIRQKDDEMIVFTLVSASQKGIGQLSAQQIEGIVKGWVDTRAKDFKASIHLNREAGRSYALYRVGQVPVVRWSYTGDLPPTDPKAIRASSVVYMVPSRDQLDFISLSTRTSNLAGARAYGDQLLSTLQVPLTVDSRRFGASMVALVGEALGKGVAALLGLVLVAGSGALVWRAMRSRPTLPPTPPPSA